MTTIEVGKFYKDAYGKRVEVVRLFQRLSETCLIGIYDTDHGCPYISLDYVKTASEKWTPWIDEPAIPWDSVLDWCQWWAVDEDLEQMFFECEPFIEDDEWIRAEGGMIVPPESHRIPYVGDWRESLRQRPRKEVA
jgi:hypothetical protein